MDVTSYRRPRGTFIFLVASSLLVALAATAQERTRASGVLRVLTYNVAGLPEGISRSRPSLNIPRMGPLLDAYDLVLVQEDFAYQAELRAGVSLPHCSTGSSGGIGDGLSRFSRHPFREHERRAWTRCNGLFEEGCDCLAEKGFTVATHEPAPGVMLDVYNLHMDAGRTPRDVAARAEQVDQLVAAIAERSGTDAVIVAGDTNIWRVDEPSLERLLAGASLVDACRTLGCRRPHGIDRVLYRSSPAVHLEARRYWIAREFVDERGRPLSDHLPVAVEIAFTTSSR